MRRLLLSGLLGASLLLAGCTGSPDVPGGSPTSTPAAPPGGATPRPPPPLAATPTWPAEAATAIAHARQDLARRAQVPLERITLALVEAQDWPSSALGCPKPGYVYTQVVTPGYVIGLDLDGVRHTYHASREGAVVTCAPD